MDHISEFSLTEIALVDRWTQLPLGSLVQAITKQNSLIIGMRSEYPDATGGADIIVVLGGSRAGEILVCDELQESAIKLDGLVEVVASYPAAAQSPKAGDISCKGNLIFISCASHGGWRGLSCVSGEPQAEIGGTYQTVNGRQTLPRAKIDVRSKARKNL